MAEFSEVDSVLREAFAHAAEPGDSAGVADAIRSRVAAGDAGTPATGSTAPGFHGGVFSVLPWIGVVVVAGIVGTGLGVGGVFGRPTDDVAVVGYTSALKMQAPIASCPGGPQVGILDSNTRVLAMERSEDNQHLGIRNPANFSSIVWIDAAAVSIDSDQPSSATLPVGNECPVATVTTTSPSPTPEPSQPAPPTTKPEPKPTTPPPPPPADTKRPTIGTPTATPNPVYNTDPTSIRVTAADNKGVSAVLISWSGQYSGSSTMTKSGSTWVYAFTPPDDSSGTITFTMKAKDAAGNLSNPVSINVNHQYFG